MFSLEEKEKGEKNDENITEKYEQDGESRSVENLHFFVYCMFLVFHTVEGLASETFCWLWKDF